jgi:hypothetical protein
LAGFGIELYLRTEIVRTYGDRIGVESEYGKGASLCFFVEKKFKVHTKMFERYFSLCILYHNFCRFIFFGRKRLFIQAGGLFFGKGCQHPRKCPDFLRQFAGVWRI